MPPKLHTKEQKSARRKELYAKKMMAKAQPEARERELALKRMKQKEKKMEYAKKYRDKQQARNDVLDRYIEEYIHKIVREYAYQGRNEVYMKIQKHMEEMGLESSDVDSVVKWNELYDKWWEDFHLNAGHTESDLATSIIKKVNHHAHEGYDKMKRALDQHVAVRKKNWDDIRRVVDIDQVYEDWWKGYHAGEKKGFHWILVRGKC